MDVKSRANVQSGFKPSEATGSVQQKFGAVLALVGIGVPVARACKEHGLPRGTYYWLLKQKEGVEPDTSNAQCTKQAETTSNNRPAQSEGTSEARAS